MSKSISIVIPSRNRPEMAAKLIEEIIQNISNHVDFEIIICENNSSSENLVLYAEKFGKNKSNRLKIINMIGTSGAGGARNKGLEVSTKEYIFFLDDDDKISEEFYTFINGEWPLDKNVYRFNVKYDSGRILKSGHFKTVKKFESWDMMQPSSYLCKRKFLIENKIHFAEGVVHQDAHFSEMIWSSKERQYVSEITSIIYNTQSESITRSNKKMQTELEAIREFEKKIYRMGSSYKFKLILWAYDLAQDYNYDLPKNEVINILYNEFSNLKQKTKAFFDAPIYFKFIFIGWLFKTSWLFRKKRYR